VSEFPAGDELLAIFVRAEEASGGQRTRFQVQPDLASGALVRHPELPPHSGGAAGVLHCNGQDIEDLADRGFLRLYKQRRTVPGGTASGDWWEFYVTPQGFQRLDVIFRSAPSASETGERARGLDWNNDVLPVLRAAYELSDESDPDQGIRTDALYERLGRARSDPKTGRILTSLVESGYFVEVIGGVMQLTGPYAFRLGEKALQRIAGWPSPGSGDEFTEKLIAVLDERIAGAQGEERSRLERLRDTLLGVGHDVFVAVVADAAKRLGGEFLSPMEGARPPPSRRPRASRPQPCR
jgi:hypothetical protein